MKRRVIISLAAVGAILIGGYRAHTTAYFDHSPYWGIPVQIKEDATVLVAEEHAKVEAEAAALPAEIAKLRETVAALVNQERHTYGLLFDSMVRLGQESSMLPEAIAKIGPMANMDLRDLTNTGRATDAINAYEALLPPDHPDRQVTSELLMHLRRAKELKGDFLERMYRHDAENPIVVEYVAPTYEYVNPPMVDGYQPPMHWVETSPGSQDRTWNISEPDGVLLGMTHKHHTDVDLVRANLVKATVRLIGKMALLRSHRARLAADEEDPVLRAAEAEAPVVFMFIQNKSRPYVWEGQSLYRCRLGVFWCSNVGSVREVFDQQHSTSLKMPHAETGVPTDGFLVEIELADREDAKAKVLHVNNGALY